MTDEETTDRPGVRVMPATEAAPLLDDPATVVLDIRTGPELVQARLPGELLHLDFHAPDFAERLAELDRDTSYLLYCRSGQRSGAARRLMDQLGFADVVDIGGGLVEWVNAELPIDVGPPRP